MFTRILARAGDFRKDFRKGKRFSQESIITRLLEQGEHFRCSQGFSQGQEIFARIFARAQDFRKNLL